MVNPDNKGIQNVIIYLFQNKSRGQGTAYDKQEVPIHESYLPLAEQSVTLDNKGCRFDPHVSLVWTRQNGRLGQFRSDRSQRQDRLPRQPVLQRHDSFGRHDRADV